MLIAMAGFPGTGKSTLAAELAAALGGVVLSKDVARAALFPAPVIDYSAAQDHIAIDAVYAAARYLLTRQSSRPVFIDGRTFSSRGQLDAPAAMARELGVPFRVIECVCADDVLRVRLAADHASGTHPAGNRTPDLLARVRANAVPLAVPRLRLDTGRLPPDECARRALAYLSGQC
ncbi:MAG: AAA family ATPase [Gemmata sp.]